MNNANFRFESFEFNPKLDSRYIFNGLQTGQLKVVDGKLITVDGPRSDELVEVIAKITDLDAWKKLTSITRFGAEISSRDGNWIVTASTTFKAFRDISNLPFVLRLEIPQKIGPADQASQDHPHWTC